MNKTTYETVSIEPNHFASVLHFTPEILNKDFKSEQTTYHDDENYFIPPHWHRALEFTYVKKGKVTLRKNGVIKQYSDGDFFIINSGELHELYGMTQDDFDIQCLIISYPLLKKLIPNLYSYSFDLNVDKSSYKKFEIQIDEIVQMTRTKEQFDYLKMNSIILNLVYMLMNDHSTTKEKSVMENQQFIIGVIDYIHFNYDKDLSLQMISDAFDLSREYFSRIFKSLIGRTFLQYLTDYRIYQAFPEIVKSDKTIESIAHKHGFSNTKSFITQFKQRYGETPLQFRKNQNISIIDHNENTFQQH